MASCFFIGHRETEEALLPLIIRAAEKLILEKQVISFYAGMYGSFDKLAGEAIMQLKKKYPQIRLYLVIPYHPSMRPVKTPPGYDGTFYPDGMETVSPKYAIAKANRKMIDVSAYLIEHVTHTASNASSLLEYAKKRERKGLLQMISLPAHTIV